MSVVEGLATYYQGRSISREFTAVPGGGDTTPDPVLIHSFNQLTGPFSDSALGNSAVVSGSPERGVNEDGNGISTGSSRDVAFSGNGSDYAVTSHIPQYENPRWGLITRLQPDTLAAAGDKQIVISKYLSGEGGRLTVEVYNDGGTGRIRVGLGAGGFVESSTGLGTVTPGTATRIGITYDGTTAKIWQDAAGVIGSEAIAGAGMDKNTADWRWGQFPDSVASYDGILGDTDFYDHDFDQAFFEASDAARSIAHGSGGPAPGTGDFVYINEPDADVSTEFAGLTHDGSDDPIVPTAGGNKTYDLRGTVRTVPLEDPPSDLTWTGRRCLLRFDGNNGAADHSGGGVSGGAAICPNMDPDYNWDSLYQSSNVPRPGLHIREISLTDYGFDGMRLHGLGWDGVGFGSGTRNTVSNITIDRFAATMQRDDFIENDNWVDNVTIQNCYAESFVFFSCRNSGFNGSSRINTVQNNLAYLLPCRIGGNPNRLAPFFKLNANSIRFRVINSIFAVPAGTPDSSSAVFGNLIEYEKLHPDSEGNTICWLGDGSFPYDNPDPSRFTVLTGSTAQDFWNNALADWWALFPGHRFAFDPPAP